MGNFKENYMPIFETIEFRDVSNFTRMNMCNNDTHCGNCSLSFL